MKNTVLFIASLILVNYVVIAQTWSLDSDFGTAGLKTFNHSRSADILYDIAPSPDGSIYAIGQIHRGYFPYSPFVLLRFDAEGKVDTSFGPSGFQVLSGLTACDDILVQQDGRILIAGREGSDRSYTVHRYLPNGMPDPSFGSMGVASRPRIDISFMRSIALTPDGKIVGVGHALQDFLMVKFNTNGTLDTSFGSGGVVYNTNMSGIGNAVGIQKDGKIIVIGSKPSFPVIMVAYRFNPDGSPDPSFGSNGIMEYGAGLGEEIVIQTDGKILIGSTADVIGGSQINKEAKLFRILEDGRLDEDFTPSTLVTPWQNDLPAGYGLVQLNNGQIVQSFFKEENGKSNMILVMHEPDGTRYDRFGTGGQLEIDLSDCCERGGSIVLDDDENLILSGNSGLDMVLLRLDPGGNMDTQYGGKYNLSKGDLTIVSIDSFPGDRILVTSLNTSEANYGRGGTLSVLDRSGDLDTDFSEDGTFHSGPNTRYPNGFTPSVVQGNNVLIAGQNYNHTLVEIARLLPNGTPDPSYGVDGYVRFPFIDSSEKELIVRSMILQKDGKILIGGLTFQASVGTYFAVARLLPDGSLDTVFGKGGIATLDITGKNSSFNRLAVAGNGNIYAGGVKVLNGGDWQFTLTKFFNDGTLDDSFGSNGITNIFTGKSSFFKDLAVQEDDKIIVVGNIESISGAQSVGILRVDGNTGMPDVSFANNGWLLSMFGSPYGVGNSVFIQENGKILVAGGVRNGSTFLYSIGRWLQDGELDTSFGDRGYITFDPGPSREGCQDILLQSDSSILVAGLTVDGMDGRADITLARIISKLNVGTIDINDRKNMLLVYPNPVGTELRLDFQLSKADQCRIALYDTKGSLVQLFERDRSFPSGSHSLTLYPDQKLPSGMYYLQLSCGVNHPVSTMVFKN